MHHRIFPALFIFSPLIIYTGFSYPYTFPRWIALAAICTLWSFALTIVFFRKKYTPNLNSLDYALLAFIVMLGIATATSADIRNSLWGSMERSFGYTLWPLLFVAYLGLKHLFQNRASKIFVEKTFILSVLVIALWGIAQKLIPGFSQTFSGSRIGGPLGNAIFYGMYLSLSIGLIAYLITAQDVIKSRIQWFYLACTAVAVALVALLLTHTRGPLLGLIAGIVITASSYGFIRAQHKIRSALIILIFISIGITGAVIAYNKNFINHTTITTRFLNWHMAWHGFLEKPLLGWGPENYRLASDAHFEPALSNFSLAETHADKPHNFFLEIAVTSGLLGIITYIFLIGILCATLLFLWKKNGISSAQLSVLLGILGISIVQNLTAFETHGSIILFIFFLSMVSALKNSNAQNKFITGGLMIMLPIITAIITFSGAWPALLEARSYTRVIALQDSYTTQHDAMNHLHNRLNSTAFQRDYFTAISFATVGQYWQNPTGMNRLSASEKNLLSTNIARLVTDISKLDELYPNNGAWKLSLAMSAFQLYVVTHNELHGALAEKLFQDLTHLTPYRQEPLLQLGQLSLLKNQTGQAIQYFDSAIALDEIFILPHWQRALALFTAQKPHDAWRDIEFVMTQNFHITSPQIANYIYDQLLKAAMPNEAEKFKNYFEGSF